MGQFDKSEMRQNQGLLELFLVALVTIGTMDSPGRSGSASNSDA
jgi:uncharacterized membrane protein